MKRGNDRLNIKLRNLFTVNFSVRTSEVIETSKKLCCNKCLKAHFIEKTKTLNLKKENLKIFEKLFNCKAGHNGYYLDQERVVKI